MIRKIPLLLIAVLALAALPQTALAKRHARHTTCHPRKHCGKKATARTTTARTALVDPATTISDPATTISDPSTTITDPGTTITDPGTTIADPATQLPNPAQSCRAEEADDHFAETHDGKDFAHFYGTNRNLRNAFGKCVSGHAHAQGGDGDDSGDEPHHEDAENDD